MKNCPYCASVLSDNAMQCHVCGYTLSQQEYYQQTPQTQQQYYQQTAQTQQQYYPQYVQPQQNYSQQYSQMQPAQQQYGTYPQYPQQYPLSFDADVLKEGKELVRKLSDRLLINGIIWIVIGAMQIIVGAYLDSIFYDFDGTVLFVIGCLNVIYSAMDINFSNKIKKKPVGIIKKTEPLAMPIITLIYNLFLGGLIGVAGSIYYLAAIRHFVMENRETFEALEENAKK